MTLVDPSLTPSSGRELQIEPVHDPAGCLQKGSDVFIFGLGFEERSTALLGEFGARSVNRLGLCFGGPKIHSYADNVARAEASSCEIIDWRVAVDTRRVRTALKDLASKASDATAFRIVVDFSSMSREMMAEVLSAISALPVAVECVFVYAPATYSRPPTDYPPISVHQPISAMFAAWPIDPQRPLELFIGLGYERGRTAAAIELFEASDVTFFFPTGGDKQYEAPVLHANREFLEPRAAGAVVSFDILGMYGTVAKLSQMISRSILSSRVVIVPFGPKTFALASMLTSLAFPGRVSVWRLSGGTSDPTPQRRWSGRIGALSVQFKPAMQPSSSRMAHA